MPATTPSRLAMPRRRRAALGLAAILPLGFVAACGADAAPPAAPTVAPTVAPARPATVPAPTAAPAPVTTAAPAPARGGAVTFTIDGTRSVATFRVNERLVGKDLPSDAVGTSKGVAGKIAIDATGKVDATASKVTVDLNALQTDSGMRDGFIKRTTLEVAKFPVAEFVPSGAEGLPLPLPVAGEATFKLSGTLTIHGTAKPVTWNVTARRDGASLAGKATTTVTFGDFGMTPPKAGAVMSVKDEIRLEIDLVATAA